MIVHETTQCWVKFSRPAKCENISKKRCAATPVLCRSQTFWTGLFFNYVLYRAITVLKCFFGTLSASLPQVGDNSPKCLWPKELRRERVRNPVVSQGQSVRLVSCRASSAGSETKSVTHLEDHKVQLWRDLHTLRFSTSAWLTSRSSSSSVKMNVWTCSSRPASVLPDGPRSHHTEPLSRHYAPPFVHGPFHVQMMHPGLLLILCTRLAAWTAPTQGLSGGNCLSGLISPRRGSSCF